MKSSKNTYNFGIIGNGSYIAHVDTKGNVRWMCWPQFDSSFVFGQLLDEQKGGAFTVSPANPDFESRQYYLPNTNVLCTEFTTSEGRFRTIDFAPRFSAFQRYHKPLHLYRKIELLDGQPRVRITCTPKGDYGNLSAKSQPRSNHIHYSGLASPLRLYTTTPLFNIENGQAFVLDSDKYLALTWDDHFKKDLKEEIENQLEKTINYWHRWVRSSTVGNFHQDKVIRSALCLKLHQYHDTGAIIAASTTSLPESDGSGRNWDYRYCWMRDSYYTIKALTDIGHLDELTRYSRYLLNIAANEEGSYQPLYSITGVKELHEITLDLDGYRGNKPVRIGNQAYTHIQNDVYGQLLVSLLPLYVDERFSDRDRINYQPQLIRHILKLIEKTMDEPDAGLWEFRNIAQKHAYTFLFHWAGSLAAQKMALKFNDHETANWAHQLSLKSQKQIENCYDADRGVYTQAIGTPNLDASLLQLITMKYLDPNSDKAKNHLKVMEKELKSHDGLFYRYKHKDDFGKPETTFLICAFWYVEALAQVGRLDEAIESFEKLSSFSNHLGLLSEDVHPESEAQWGNFPQTYSHVGLMNAAFRISMALDRPNFL